VQNQRGHIHLSVENDTDRRYQRVLAGRLRHVAERALGKRLARVLRIFRGGQDDDWKLRPDAAKTRIVPNGIDPAPLQPVHGGAALRRKLGIARDAFVTKFTTTGALAYSTYLGGSVDDLGFAIAVDASGNAYVTGTTESLNFPTLNPIQTANNFGGASFVTKLNSQGSGLAYSTYLGAASARGIAVDSTGNAYVTGFSSSGEFPLTAGALRTRSPIYKSIDEAANWSNDNYGLGEAVVIDIVVNPIQPWILYAGTGKGVFKSTDGGRNWAAVNNGLNARRLSAIVIDPLNPSTLYVATNEFNNANNGIYNTTDG